MASNGAIHDHVLTHRFLVIRLEVPRWGWNPLCRHLHGTSSDILIHAFLISVFFGEIKVSLLGVGFCSSFTWTFVLAA